MALFKCKMCGGNLEVSEGVTIATCEYCGTKQTIPKLDDERKSNLYDRANHFRRNNDFDKAMSIYEQILDADPTDAESYWSLVLCRYGIEYVEDPATKNRIPTVNRAQFTSIFDDENYKSAIEHADTAQRAIYEEEANTINEIQKGILAISLKEEPFDVFICYKETDANGKRTQDSVLAQDLYFELKQEGFKVFFSRITLEDKLGVAYEPYIFAALNSSKVMVVLGTTPDNFNAVWVRNEWSRYLALIKQGAKKTIIPAYRDMDPYDLPEEFSHLQAQDMSKLGFMQDLIRGIKKILGKTAPAKPAKEGAAPNLVAEAAPLLRRAFMFLEDGNWREALSYCEKVLDRDPENADAYVGKLMADLKVRKMEQLAECRAPFTNNGNFNKAIRFGDEKLKATLNGYIDTINKNVELQQLEGKYQNIIKAMSTAKNERDFILAAECFGELKNYKDSEKLKQECLKKAEEVKLAAAQNAEVERKNTIYATACRLRARNNIADITKAIELFRQIPAWKNSEELAVDCEKLIEKIKEEAEKQRIEKERREELERQKKEERKKKTKKFLKVFIPVLLAVFVAILLTVFLIIPSVKLDSAVKDIAATKYTSAEAKLKKLEKGFYWYMSTEGKLEIIDFIEKQNGTNRTIADESGFIIEEELENALDPMLNVKAKGTINNWLEFNEKVTVKYDLAGGTSSAGDKTTYKKNYSALPVPEKDGYHFEAWKFVECSYTKKDSLTISLVAVWSDEYKITYDLDGGSADNPTEYHKDAQGAITLKTPTKTGYTFLGWKGTDIQGSSMSVTIPAGSYGDRVYTATWKANEYTFTLNANGGNVNTTSFKATFDTNYSLPIPTKENYTFGGWYDGDTQYKNGSWHKDGNVTLVAKWNATPYKVTYELDGGKNSPLNPETTNIDQAKFTLKDPTKEGYLFMGWYKDADKTQKVTEIPAGTHQEVTYYAKWSIINYTISYDLNGATLSGTKVTSFTIHDLPIALPTATKSNSEFLGWKLDTFEGSTVTSITKCENVKLYAAFLDKNLKLTLKNANTANAHYAVTGYTGTASSIDIPARYDGYPVGAISANAFTGKASLRTVNIPSTVTTIENYAFSGCYSLSTINFPNSITSIGSNAFEGCTGLKNVTLPSSLTSLGTNAFYGCTALTTVSIPGSLETIPSRAFEGCSKLSTVTLNEGIKTISSNAFGSEKIEEIIIPKSVTSISSSSFKGYNTSSPDCSNIVFYCKASSASSGWQSGWNNGRPVVYSYNESTFTYPTYKFETNGGAAVSSIKNIEVKTEPTSHKVGYVLIGWYDNPSFTGSAVSFPYFSMTKTTLYAKWMSEDEYYDGSTRDKAVKISLGLPKTVSINNSNKYYLRFVCTETREYLIETSEAPNAEITLYKANGTTIDYDYATSGKISMIQELKAGDIYYIAVERYYSSGSCVCSISIN